MRRKGFTLIEMLIVIAVIGVLAVAVLSAINPIEQMRKARDTRRRSNAAELLNAVERYYATHEAYPIDFSVYAAGGNTCAAAAVNSSIPGSSLATLVATDELKVDFTTRVDDPGGIVYAGLDITSDLVRVCYEVESKANRDTLSACLDGTATLACIP